MSVARPNDDAGIEAPDCHNSYEQNEPNANPPLPRGGRVRLIVFFVLAAGVGAVWWLYRDEFSVERVLARKDQLDELVAERPAQVYAAAFLIYTGVTSISLPVAAALTLLYPALLGFWPGLVIVSFASTAGATVAFLTSRYLLRDTVQASLGRYLPRINAELEADGALYLFTLRLTPVFPYVIVNLVLGLSPMRVWTYWWVSQLGMLPGTCLYAYAGATIDIEQLTKEGAGALFTWDVIVAFALLGLSPLVLKKTVDWMRGRRHSRAL